MDPVTFQTIPKIESTVLPDDTELEKLADRAMRAIQLHNAFRKRMENKIKIREEAAKAAAEAARLAYERALAHLNAVYEANRVLEERLKISDSASESASTVYDQGDTKAEGPFGIATISP